MEHVKRQRSKGRKWCFVFVLVAAVVLWRGMWMPGMWSMYFDAWMGSGQLVYYGRVCDKDGTGTADALVTARVTRWNPLYILGKHDLLYDVDITAKSDSAGRFVFSTRGKFLYVTRVACDERSVDTARAGLQGVGTLAKPVIIEFDRLYQVQQEDREREQNLMRPWYERK